MDLHRRRLPHVQESRVPVFLTWCLHGAMPSNRVFEKQSMTSGQAFAVLDRLMDEGRTGPVYLRQPEIAEMVVEAIHHGAEILAHYELHSFVVMPNHVHVLITPLVPLPKLLRSVKGITAKRANSMLGRSGEPFWQDESYDHMVRSQREFERICSYIHNNPVRAGLVPDLAEYRWSSFWGTRGSPADQGVCPTSA
jgi:putative transposase